MLFTVPTMLPVRSTIPTKETKAGEVVAVILSLIAMAALAVCICMLDLCNSNECMLIPNSTAHSRYSNMEESAGYWLV